MPANPKDLYNSLKDAGELSISYADFREQWDTPGWNVDFHKHLQQKQLTSLDYEDFVYTFGENDPTWDAENGIEITDAELDAASQEGKELADQQPRNKPAENSTGFPSADGSWVLPEPEAKQKQAENIISKAPARSIEKAEALNALYGNDLEAQVSESNTITLDGLEDYVKALEADTPKKEVDAAGKMLNQVTNATIVNIPVQWEAAWEGTKALVIAGVGESEGGGGLADALSGNSAFGRKMEFVDPVTDKRVSWESDQKRYRALSALARNPENEVKRYYKGTELTPGQAADVWVGEKLNSIKKLNETTGETGSIVKGFKEGDPVELFGGVVNAVSSLAATMLPAMATGGATLAPQVIAPMWVDYNTTKAETKYADADDPIAAMIAAEDTEFALPLTLGAGALVLESVGFKGISKYMAGTKVGGSIMGLAKNKVAWMLTANKEGGTEWFQGGLEAMNTEFAKGKSTGYAIEMASKHMFSEDGLEEYLQGAFGSGIHTAPSAAKRVISRALHSDPDGHNIVTEGIADIASLKEQRLKAKSKVTRDVIDRDIKTIEGNIKQVIQDNNNLVKYMTDRENGQLRSIMKEKDVIAADLTTIENDILSGKITKKEAGYAKRKLNTRNTKLSQDIADLKANIDLSKIRSDVKLAQKLAKNMPNLKIESHTSEVDVRKSIEGAADENGKPYSKEQLDKFAKESAGLFWVKDGVEHIVINESLSKEAGLTATGQHEFLHKVLNKVLNADPSLAIKMGGAVKETLKKLIESGDLTGKINPATGKSRLEERLDEYKGQSSSIQAEELITILSEALTNGDIKITEANKSFFGNVKELVRRSFLDMGITSVKLDGDNVLQFIKDYNREYARGRFSRSTKKIMESGKINASKIKQSLDTNDIPLAWDETSTGSYETEPVLIGDSEITLGIETTTNKKLAESHPELGINPAKPLYNIFFKDRITEFEPTDGGAPLEVFGTVVNGMKHKLAAIGAEQIMFTGDQTGNRQRLYTLMGATLAKQLGLNFNAVVLDKRVSYMPKGDKVFVITAPEGGMKQSLGAKDLYGRTDDLYNEYKDDKHTAGFLIGMEWQNQIEKLTKKYRNLPGYAVNIEDVVSYVMTANQGIPGLVNSYKPGTKTKDGGAEVSLAGYINKYLPNYINTALGKHGIGEAKDEGGFAINVSDMVDLTASETAEDTLNLDTRAAEEVVVSKHPQLKDAIKIEEAPEVKADIENRVGRNVSAAIKFFGKAKTKNEKIDAFVKATRKGIKDDEKASGTMFNHIMGQGLDNFLTENKVAFLANTQRNDLQRSPLFKKAVQQRFKGVWKSREAVTIYGKVSYEYLKEDGSVYPARHPDMDRDKLTETGTTAGHYKFRKAPKLQHVISDNEFIDFFYKDGAKRTKVNKVKVQALASQFSAEIGLELFAEQLNERKGPIFDVLETRIELTEEMTPEQVKAANEQKLIIREGMATVLTDKGIAETLKDLERGGIKQSKVNKTGFGWFDSPRIAMTGYLAGLENNDIRSGVVDGTIKSPDYKGLYTEMKDAYDMYLGMQSYKEEWAENLKNYSTAFKDKKFSDFNAFVDHTLGQVNNSVNGILGVSPAQASLGIKNESTKAITRREGIDTYINETLNALPRKERGDALARIVQTLVGAVSGSKSGALYHNTPGFYQHVVVPMINAHGIKASDFALTEVDGGTTITHKGKKITTNYARGVYADDTFGMFEALAENPAVLTNGISIDERAAEAKIAVNLYLDYLSWLNTNYARLSPTTVAMIMKGFSNSRRSVAQVMIPLKGAMLVQQAEGIENYSMVPSVPSKYVSLASLKYVMTGEGLGDIRALIGGASQAIMPKTYAKIIEQFHHNTPNNNFDSKEINAKLKEVDLPKIDLTNLATASTIGVANLDGKAAVIKFNKTVETVGQSMKFSKVPKGISVWDFDDTLAKTNSKVRYTDANGKPQKLTPAEFAEKGDALMDQGIEFDFSEFSKVVQGKKGPLFDVAVKRNEKFGNKNVFILTARPQNSAHAIHEFLKGIGLDIRIENITGLQDSSPQAKASWVQGKVTEGYNDFYFADDHIGNVSAVKDVLKDVDVKSDVVQAGMKQSVVLSDEFNAMLERTNKLEGLTKRKVKVDEANQSGKLVDTQFRLKPRLFVPPSAEDFMGLLYKFLGKGKQGNLDKQWLMDNLVDPYITGVERLDVMNTTINVEYKALIKNHPEVSAILHEKIEGLQYTYDMAIRYYLYERSGHGEMMQENVSARDGMKLMKTVMTDKKLRIFADALSIASRQESGYTEPDADNWLTQSIATDFKRLITDAHRKHLLQQFIDNTDIVFSPENLNKIQSIYGTKFKKALIGAIKRMKSGTNQGGSQGSDATTAKATLWLTGAIAPIMFLNQRSALLQLLSVGNFVNWTDNSPLLIAKAMANPKQLWKDMVHILKSPKMVQRRNGLRFSIEEAELANVGGIEGAWGVFYKRMIKIGFAPTQIFDGLAIAIGGAPMYRNRVNTYLKQGMALQDAEATAWKDFARISDEAQQSSDQMLTSAEQSGGLGRIILAFANTPAQYTRLMKKAALDIKNGRGDLKTNLSKIAYYGFLQNLIFSSLQTALFTTYGIFADDDEEERDEKYRKQVYDDAFANAREPRKGSTKPKNTIEAAKAKADAAVMDFNKGLADRVGEKKDRVVNGMLDTILRGLGVRGAAISTLKNVLVEILGQSDNRQALKDAEKEGNIEIMKLYNKVLSGDITIDEAEEGEALLKKQLSEIDPGKPIYNTTKILLSALSISPPLGAKARDFNKMLTNERYNAELIAEKGWSYDSPRWMTVGLGLKTAANVPGDWIPKKIEIIKQITQGDGTTSQKAMMGLGWSPYDMGLKDLEFERIKEELKVKKKDATADKKAMDKDLKKLKVDAKNSSLTPAERKAAVIEAKRNRSAAGKKAAATRRKNKSAKNRTLWQKAQDAATARRKN